MFCHRCGTQMPDDSRYCRRCGIELIQDPAPATAVEQLAEEMPPPSISADPSTPKPVESLDGNDLSGLPPIPVRRGEWRKRRRRRKWYQKLGAAIEGSASDVLKVAGLVLAALILYLLLSAAR